MKSLLRKLIFSAVFLFIVFSFACILPADAKTEKVCVIKISDKIDHATVLYVNRALSSAKKDKCRVVVFEIDSAGGNFELCDKIKEVILQSPLETIGYIRGKAIGNAVLIPLACNKVYMAPGAIWGSGNDTGSTLKAALEVLAQNKSKSVQAAGAMSDPNYNIEGLTNDGKSLTMTPDMAMNLNLSDGTASDSSEFLQPSEGYNLKVVEKKPTWMEMLSGAVANPVFAVVILVLGICGAVKEMMIPGHGVGAAIAFVFLGLFFGGKFIAGNAGLLAIIIFTIGILLLIVEIVAIPGMGVPGILGIGCVGASIIMSFEDVNTGATVFALVLIFSILLLVLFFKYVSKSNFVFDKFVVKPIDDGMAEVVAAKEEVDFNVFLGKTGKASTDLRPYGKACFDGKTIDVTTNDGKYAPKDEEVVVVQVEGNKVIVTPVKNIEIPA